MLIIYDRSDGTVLENTGTSEAWPEGPPEDRGAWVNVDARGIDRAGLALLRLHDRDDADLVAEVLANRHHVDPDTGQVVIDGPYPQPDPAPDPDEELRAALEAATTVAQLRDALLGKTSGVTVAATRRPNQEDPA